MFSLGYEEYFYQKKGVVVIEWAEKIKDLLPAEYLQINLETVSLSKRKITAQTYGSSYRKLIKKMEKLSCFC